MTGKRFDVSKYLTTSLREIDKRLHNANYKHNLKTQDLAHLKCCIHGLEMEIATLKAERKENKEVQAVLGITC